MIGREHGSDTEYSSCDDFGKQRDIIAGWLGFPVVLK